MLRVLHACASHKAKFVDIVDRCLSDLIKDGKLPTKNGCLFPDPNVAKQQEINYSNELLQEMWNERAP